jgi:hypothetical protein
MGSAIGPQRVCPPYEHDISYFSLAFLPKDINKYKIFTNFVAVK